MSHLILLTLFVAGAPQAQVEADFVIRGGKVFDGSAQNGDGEMFDVAVLNGRIAAVGQFETDAGVKVIDATGLIVAPGFIDLHTHSDRPILSESTRDNANYLFQGVTTIVTGNCGGGHVDVGAFYQDLDENGVGSNVAHLIPHGSLRREVMGNAAREPSEDEFNKIKELLEKGMRDGAWGMSTGLIYRPGTFAKTKELVALATIISRHRGFYASHIRNENTKLLDAVNEAISIGKQAELPVHISHFKASGTDAWGLSRGAIEIVRAAREAGAKVTADQYPYAASSTSLAAMVLPANYRSWPQLKEALDDKDKAETVRRQIETGLKSRGDGERLFVASHRKNRSWQGRNLKEIAEKEGKPVVEIVIEIQRGGGASMVNFGMDEEEVRLIMQQPFVAAASDGSARKPDNTTVPHPRSYGCYPRKIGRYAIEEKVITLSHAIRSASGLPADILGFKDRGYIKKGFAADIVIFDPKSFRDTATFEKPHQYATGVRHLFVNGAAAIENGKLTGKLAGKALRHRPEGATLPTLRR